MASQRTIVPSGSKAQRLEPSGLKTQSDGMRIHTAPHSCANRGPEPRGRQVPKFQSVVTSLDREGSAVGRDKHHGNRASSATDQRATRRARRLSPHQSWSCQLTTHNASRRGPASRRQAACRRTRTRASRSIVHPAGRPLVLGPRELPRSATGVSRRCRRQAQCRPGKMRMATRTFRAAASSSKSSHPPRCQSGRVPVRSRKVEGSRGRPSRARSQTPGTGRPIRPDQSIRPSAQSDEEV